MLSAPFRNRDLSWQMILDAPRNNPIPRGAKEYARCSSTSVPAPAPGTGVQQEGSKCAGSGGVSFALGLDIFGTSVEAVEESSSPCGDRSCPTVDISRKLEDGWVGNPCQSSEKADQKTTGESEHCSKTTESQSGVDNVDSDCSILVSISDSAEHECEATAASVSVCALGSGCQPLAAANDIVLASAAGQDEAVTLKSALKGSSPRPSGLRVSWAADVYDPIPSLMSHTVGRRGHRKSFSRRQRNDHGGKAKHGGKSSKSSKSSKKSSKENAPEKPTAREADKLPSSAPSSSSHEQLSESAGEPAKVDDTVKKDVVQEDAGTAAEEKQDDAAGDDGWSIVIPKSHGRRSRVGGTSPSGSPPLTSCSPPKVDPPPAVLVTPEFPSICGFDGAECTSPSPNKPDMGSLFVKVGGSSLDDDSLFSPESTLENPVFASREGSPELSSSPPASAKLLERVGSSGFDSVPQCNMQHASSPSNGKKTDFKQRSSAHKSSSVLAKISMERLAGATALAHGKVPEGRQLVYSAYMSARKHGLKGEEARCLRLIADTQTGQDRLSSLTAAVEGLALAGVPFEHAEALLCLAQHEVQESISLSGFAYTSIDIVASLEKLSCSLEAPQQNACLVSAQSHLRTAASLLTCELSTPKYRFCSKSFQSQYNSPTGRRKSSSSIKKLKKPDLLEEERATLSGLLGSVHELAGKVGILMQQFDDARVALHAAASNEDWRKVSREEAFQVDGLLQHLLAGSFCPRNIDV